MFLLEGIASVFTNNVINVYLLYWIIIIMTAGVNVSATISIIVFVSNSVLINSIDYLGIIDNVLFLVYICLFQFSMITFILTHDLIINFINWDLLGIISYLLINYWVSNVNSGIKAIVYNNVGDIFFVLWLALLYDFWSSFSLILINLLINVMWTLFYSSLFSIPILIIIFSNSAQLPFTSWLLNAMSAPTPISALLHSSTMVIAGVWLGLIIDDHLILLLDISCFFSLLFLLSSLLTLLFSLWSAISVSDVNSIIAFSTVSQISYMFLALIINPILSLFISWFMHYLSACYLYYQDHLFILNQTINRFLDVNLITFLC